MGSDGRCKLKQSTVMLLIIVELLSSTSVVMVTGQGIMDNSGEINHWSWMPMDTTAVGDWNFGPLSRSLGHRISGVGDEKSSLRRTSGHRRSYQDGGPTINYRGASQNSEKIGKKKSYENYKNFDSQYHSSSSSFSADRRHDNYNDNNDESTWLSSSYLSPPPRPRRGHGGTGADYNSGHYNKMYDYKYYDRRTYNVANVRRLYADAYQDQNQNQNQNYFNQNQNQNYFNYNQNQINFNSNQNLKKETSIRTPPKLKQTWDRNANVIIAVPGNRMEPDMVSSNSSPLDVDNQWGNSPFKEPLIKINMGKLLHEFNSICSLLMPKMELRYFCTKKP